jgi:hypothetical protein
MLGSPALYNVGADYLEGDAALVQKRADLIHSAAVLLEKGGLIRYDRATGVFQSTDLGRIASHYYVAYTSMSIYNKHLKPNMNMIDLFRVFALSNEFKLIPIRQEEKLELAKLIERVPIPVKEGVDEPIAKINVLLQAYISQLKLGGFDIVTDMVFIQQSAGRIIRAMFEICLKKGWAGPMRHALDLCKMVERRMWKSMSPLRQFPKIPQEIVTRAERKEFPWYRYFDLDAAELGELIGLPKSGQRIESLVHKFPRLDIQAQSFPLLDHCSRSTSSLLPISYGTRIFMDHLSHSGSLLRMLMVNRSCTMINSFFERGLLPMSTTLQSLYPSPTRYHPITTSPSFPIDGYNPRHVFLFHSPILSDPKLSLPTPLCSTFNHSPFMLFTTSVSNSCTHSSISTRSKPRSSRLYSPPTIMSSLALLPVVERRYVPSLLYFDYGLNPNHHEQFVSSHTRKWSICESQNGQRSLLLSTRRS